MQTRGKRQIRLIVIVVVLVGLVTFHKFHRYLGYFHIEKTLVIETRTGKEYFLNARIWTNLHGDTVVKDGKGTHLFRGNTVLSILYPDL